MKLLSAVTGATGIALIESTSHIDPSNISDILKAAIQVVIAAVTLWQLLKKKPPQK